MHDRNYSIHLNFLPVQAREFWFIVYTRPLSPGFQSDSSNRLSHRRLPVPGSDGPANDFLVSMEPKEGFSPLEIRSSTNIHITKQFLLSLLTKASKDNLQASDFLENDGFYRRIEFILERHTEGLEVVWLEPYFLKQRGLFGFLIDFKLIAFPGFEHSKRVQYLSLSLDKAGRSNRDSYSDRYDKIQAFLHRFHSRLFPLDWKEQRIEVDRRLLPIEADFLEKKRYVFGASKVGNSQFQGVKENGPLELVQGAPQIVFVFREEDRPLSQDLYRALRGETFPATFPGMEKMFRLPLDRQTVRGLAVASFSPSELERLSDLILASGHSKNVAVFVVPWHNDSNYDLEYYRTKRLLLSHSIPSQVVLTDTLKNRESLKWSISNIGLQIFAKLGGKPWKVAPQTESCLIIGFGQAHKLAKPPEKKIEKYFAFTVLTDSTGLYREIRSLGRSTDRHAYLGELKRQLADIFEQYKSQFRTLVVHTPFKVRRDEIEAIIEVSKSHSDSTGRVVVLKVNEKNKFFGYYQENNSLIPYESSFLQLSRAEFLVWFEGLQYGKPNVYRRVASPIHIEFLYPEELRMEEKISFLQDALNLSGANWRGFNAKSRPVSIYYAQIIADFLGEFEMIDQDSIELSGLYPWFL